MVIFCGNLPQYFNPINNRVKITTVIYHGNLPQYCFITLAPGVNFTNILRAAFSYESFLRRFYVLTIWVCIFWQMDFGAKAAHKMLVKLPPGDRNWQLIYPNCLILL